MALPRRFGLLLPLTAICLYASSESNWVLARDNHFEVYAQAGVETARSALDWFEQLRALFLRQMNVDPDSRPPLRVIGFRSAVEYKTYSSRPAADAYYLGSDSRDYIVMSNLGADQFGVAAHEYAHFLLHANGMRLPPWLSEGLAEFYSSVRITSKGSSMGGPLFRHAPALRGKWMPLDELFATTANAAIESDRKRAGRYYAQSWILTHMLVRSPEYSGRFQVFIAALTSGTSSARAFATVYGKTLDAVNRDVHAWPERGLFTPLPLSAVVRQTSPVQVSDLAVVASRLMLADLVFTGGDLNRAENLYRELARQSPDAADVYVGLGAIALARDDRDGARFQWRRAIDLGVEDPQLCYRYAVLAQDARLSYIDIRAPLARALELQPDFDDARYTLALLDMNTGHNEAAVEQFRAMKRIAPARAYSYWSALSYTLGELDMRDEAKAAALEARKHASTAAEQAHALELAYMAETDFAVRFTRDANGRAQIVTARAPHNQTDWNPFIEPADRMRRVEGTLREIHCSGTALHISVNTTEGLLLLAIPDASRVQMRNAPAEFTCGDQPPRRVTVEYAAPDQVRGIEFR